MYKRLTERNYTFVCMDCNNCELKRDCNQNKCFVRAKYRLAELEDKIENGTLVFKESEDDKTWKE